MKKINRREFLRASAAGAVTCCLASPAAGFSLFNDSHDPPKRGGPSNIRGHIFKGEAPEKLWKWSREAFHYSSLDKSRTLCNICPNQCLLSPGDRSICRSKVNLGGKLYSLTYGNPCAVQVDPIEKKPLLHFKPRSLAFSIATTGCNFRCLNCQNWEISQKKPEEIRHYDLFPEEVIQSALKNRCSSIAYTYSEATTFFEYMYDTAQLARDNGLDNLWISNGYINAKPLLALCRVIDGANINLKAYSDDIYKKLNGGRLQPVLNTLQTLHRQKVHFEITNLVVPGYTDDAELVKKMCHWILENLGPDYPLHFSRFTPKYHLKRLPPTPVDTLTNFRQIALNQGLHYVYVGNVPGHEGQSTYCHGCGQMLLERNGYQIGASHIKNGQCTFCKTKIPGVWEQ